MIKIRIADFLKITSVCVQFIGWLALCVWAATAAVLLRDSNIKEKNQPILAKPLESCFLVSNTKYLFSSEYIHLWPEYYDEQGLDESEGTAEGECSPSARSVSLAMNWPELTPGDYFSENFNGIVVTLEPWSIGERGLRETLNHFMSRVTPDERNANTVRSSSGMYHITVIDTVFPAFPRKIFWYEDGRSMEVIGICRWSAYRSKYHFCHVRYLSDDGEIIVKIDFGWEDFNSLNEISSRVNNFLSNKKIEK